MDGDWTGSIDLFPVVETISTMWKRSVAFGIILAGAVAAYLPATDGDFLFDDLPYLRDPLVTAPFQRGLAPWLTVNRPLTTLTFALNHLATGLDSRGWHLTNLVIHLLVVVLVWAFARMTLLRAGLSRSSGVAVATAGVFALHPLQSESVAYIAQRAESLATCFYLAALLLLLWRDTETRPWARRGLAAGAVGLHVIGLSAKPIGVTLPVAWILHVAMLPAPSEAGLRAWQRVRRRAVEASLMFALSASAAILFLAGLDGSGGVGFGLPGLSPTAYAATQLRVIPTYLRLLVWPSGQCADWFFPLSRSFAEPGVLGGAAFLGAILAGAIYAAVRFRTASGDFAAVARTASFGALFFLIVIAPTSSVVPIWDPLAEHRIYLAGLGVMMTACAAITLALRRLAGALAAPTAVALSTSVLLSLGIATTYRNAVWKSSLALWSDAVQKAPLKARVHDNLGYALRQANRLPDALAHFYRARELENDGTVSLEMVSHGILQTLILAGNVEKARVEAHAILMARPGDAAATAAMSTIAFLTGSDDQCERAALAVLASKPNDAISTSALTALGSLLVRRGDLTGARASLRRAAATGYGDSMTYMSLGMAEERLGDKDAACEAYARASALPGNPWTPRNSSMRLRCP